MLATTAGVDIAPSDSVTYRVGVIEIDRLELVGAGSMQMDRWEAELADVYLMGVGDIDISDLATPELSVVHNGVGDIVLIGEVDSQDVNASGVGHHYGGDLRSATAVVNAEQTGSVTIWVTDALDAMAVGSGSISYYGSPAVTEREEGLGSITPLGDK